MPDWTDGVIVLGILCLGAGVAMRDVSAALMVVGVLTAGLGVLAGMRGKG